MVWDKLGLNLWPLMWEGEVAGCANYHGEEQWSHLFVEILEDYILTDLFWGILKVSRSNFKIFNHIFTYLYVHLLFIVLHYDYIMFSIHYVCSFHFFIISKQRLWGIRKFEDIYNGYDCGWLLSLSQIIPRLPCEVSKYQFETSKVSQRKPTLSVNFIWK